MAGGGVRVDEGRQSSVGVKGDMKQDVKNKIRHLSIADQAKVFRLRGRLSFGEVK